MKTMDVFFSGRTVLTAMLMCGMVGLSYGAPKKVLVVTVTKGFRHSSISTAEKVLGELATKSGLFSVDYARVEPSDRQFRKAEGGLDTNKVDMAIRQVLAEKMSAAALANYDA